MSSRLISLFVIACCVSRTLAQDNADAKLTLTSVTERRANLLVKDDASDSASSGLELGVQATGKALANARAYGHLRISKAVDDLGNDLTKTPDSDASQPTPMALVDSFGGDEPQEGFHFEIRALHAIPPRHAKSIKVIEGTVDILAGGEQKFIDVPIKPEMYEKPVDDPALKAIGITVTLHDPRTKTTDLSFGDGATVPVTVVGDYESIGAISVVDAAGNSIVHGSASHGFGGAILMHHFVKGDLPDGAKLRIEAWLGHRKVTVPFKFENIELR